MRPEGRKPIEHLIFRRRSRQKPRSCRSSVKMDDLWIRQFLGLRGPAYTVISLQRSREDDIPSTKDLGFVLPKISLRYTTTGVD